MTQNNQFKHAQMPETARETESGQIVTTRLFDAPREQLYGAWTDPELLARWWGPKGFTNTFHAFSAEPDGEWIYTMHGPDGTDYPNKSVFRELDYPKRIVLEHLEPMHHFNVAATFEEEAGKTRLTFQMTFDTTAECDRVRVYVQEANEQNFDRLEALMTSAG
jgi:uncharacterized protein YndB with AHSA1/START domain